jgi:hypothetical protein
MSNCNLHRYPAAQTVSDAVHSRDLEILEQRRNVIGVVLAAELSWNIRRPPVAPNHVYRQAMSLGGENRSERTDEFRLLAEEAIPSPLLVCIASVQTPMISGMGTG